jgi:enoyl-CoA hydratase/carnithine racemase
MAAAPAGRPPEGDWLGTPYVRFERHGHLAHCIVDRPQARNAMTASMYFAVRYAVDVVNRDADLAGMLLTGTGDVFIPGGDLGGASEDDWGGVSRLLGMDTTPFEAIRNSRKPVVSAVNGICQGGGLLMAMLSDVAVASTGATFRCPELYRGIADTGYAAYLPTQIGPARARDMLLTGRTLDADEAHSWGLVSRLSPPERLLEDAAGPAGGQADHQRGLRPVRPDVHGRQPRERRVRRGLDGLQGTAVSVVGARGPAGRRSPLDRSPTSTPPAGRAYHGL